MGDARIQEPSEPELFYLCNLSLLRVVWARQTHSIRCFTLCLRKGQHNTKAH